MAEVERFPVVFIDPATNNRYHITEVVGTYTVNENCTIIVHRAAMILNNVQQDQDVYLKCIRVNHESRIFLQAHANMNRRIPGNENLLRISAPFTHNNIYYSVVYPYMDSGSLSSIMKRKFRYGLPEDLILVALRETLNGLLAMHEDPNRMLVHGEINPSHIFLNSKPLPQIKLSYKASVTDLDFDDQESSTSSTFYLRKKIYDWGSAPEVYYHPGPNEDLVYTPPADVWSIGITALELAFGEIRVDNRAEFDQIVAWIIRKNRLPKKPDKGYLQVKAKMHRNEEDAYYTVRKPKVPFSEGFSTLVAQCLVQDPAIRPTVDQLLGLPIFGGLKTVVQFHNEVTNV